MDLLFWITLSFIIIGLIVLVSLKGKMESKVALLKGNIENKKISATPVILWISATTVWGLISIFLVLWWFSLNF